MVPTATTVDRRVGQCLVSVESVRGSESLCTERADGTSGFQNLDLGNLWFDGRDGEPEIAYRVKRIKILVNPTNHSISTHLGTSPDQ